MKKLFILSEKELSDIVKARVQGMVDSLTDSIVREIAWKNNLNKMQYLWQENNLGCSSCGLLVMVDAAVVTVGVNSRLYFEN